MTGKDRPERGATTIEAALLIVLIFTLIFAGADFGLWAFESSQAASAARDASRVAALNPNAAGAIEVAAEEKLPNKPDSQVTAVVTRCTGSCAPGDQVTVTVTFPRLALPLPWTSFGQPPDVSASSTRHIVGVPR